MAAADVVDFAPRPAPGGDRLASTMSSTKVKSRVCSAVAEDRDRPALGVALKNLWKAMSGRWPGP